MRKISNINNLVGGGGGGLEDFCRRTHVMLKFEKVGFPSMSILAIRSNGFNA